MKKPTPVTKERLELADHYRAQVQLPNKLAWAVGYNAVFHYNSDLSANLRDALGDAVQKRLVAHLKTLCQTQEFLFYYRGWLREYVAQDCKAEVYKWIHDNLPEVL